jgi:hypothetical protein
MIVSQQTRTHNTVNKHELQLDGVTVDSTDTINFQT